MKNSVKYRDGALVSALEDRYKGEMSNDATHTFRLILASERPDASVEVIFRADKQSFGNALMDNYIDIGLKCPGSGVLVMIAGVANDFGLPHWLPETEAFAKGRASGSVLNMVDHRFDWSSAGVLFDRLVGAYRESYSRFEDQPSPFEHADRFSDY